MTTRSRKYFNYHRAMKFIQNNGGEVDIIKEGLYPSIVGYDPEKRTPIYGYLIDANGRIYGSMQPIVNVSIAEPAIVIPNPAMGKFAFTLP